MSTAIVSEPLIQTDAQELIDRILKKRHRFADRIETVQRDLRQQRENLIRLIDVTEHASEIGTSSIRQVFTQPLSVLHESLIQMDRHVVSLQSLQTRFRRETLYIVVVGKSRQGKSTFLQNVCGLTSLQIPSGRAGDCTSVPSIIHHHEGESYAEISFHSRKSFFEEVIVPYFEEIQPGNCPASLEAFLAKPYTLIPSDDALNTSLQQRLSFIRDNFERFSRYLTGEAAKRIELSAVREHVAKCDEQGNEVYLKYLAVREARVHCPFPNHGMRKIALVDSQGLGSVEVGIERRIISAVASMADAVIFVRKPTATGDDLQTSDIGLYDTVRSAVPGLPLEKWSFVVMNQENMQHDNPRQYEQCLHLERKWARSEHKVAGIFIADCSLPTVASEVLLPVLNYLSQRLEDIDQSFATGIQKQIDATLQSTSEVVGRLKQLAESSTDLKGDNFKFSSRFESLMAELERMLQRTSSVRLESIDTSVRDAITSLLSTLREQCPIPSAREFESMMQPDRHLMTFLEAMTDTRHFVTVTAGDKERMTKQVLEDVRNDLRHVFETTGLLAGLNLPEGPEWWKRIGDLLGPEPEQRQLAERLVKLGDFLYSTQSRVANKIDPCLNHLRPDQLLKLPLKLSWKPGPSPEDWKRRPVVTARETTRRMKSLMNRTANPEAEIQASLFTPEEAVEALRAALHDTINDIEKRMATAGKEIAQEVASEIGQFVDVAFRRGNSKVWRELYSSNKEQIWPEEFARQGERKQALVAVREHSIALQPLIDLKRMAFARS